MEWKEDASVEVTFRDCIECKGTGVVGLTVPEKCSICEGKGTVIIKEERHHDNDN
jgi:DnaJ-class molecular chaperone